MESFVQSKGKQDSNETTSVVKSTGANLYGQLGRKGAESAVEPIPKFLKEGIPICYVATGSHHSAAVSLMGNIFTWGTNAEGECGFNTQYRTLPEPMQVPDLKARHIVKVACGGHFTIAITASMETFIFGTVDLVSRARVFSSFVPHQIGKYVDAFAGWAHGALLDNKGRLFMFGSGCYGRLGNGTKDDIAPHSVKKLEISEKVVSAALGADFSLVLTEDGKLYSFGFSEHGELGQGTTLSCFTPKLIPTLEKEKIIKISAGTNHCAAIDSNYNLWTWGFSDCGQLGHNDFENQSTPKLVAALKGQSVVDVACGNHHSIFITNEGFPFILGTLGPPFKNPLPKSIPMATTVFKVASNGMHALFLEGKLSSLHTSFLPFVNNPQFADFKFSVNGNTFYGHSIFLSRVKDYEKILGGFFLSRAFITVLEAANSKFPSEKVIQWLHNIYGILSTPTDILNLPKENTFKHLASFVNQKRFSDVQFRFPDEDNAIVYAHKVVIASRCSFFKAMFEGGLKEAQSNIVDIKSSKSSVYVALMEYLYTGTLRVSNPDDCIDLLMLTEEYNLSHLKTLCEVEISDAVDIENAAYLFAVAKLHRATTLKAKSVLFIMSNLEAVAKSPAYKSLSASDVEDLHSIIKSYVM